MNARCRKSYAKVVTTICIAMAIGIAGVRADTASCGVERDVGARALDEINWNRLSAIDAIIAEGKYQEAREDLRKMLPGANHDRYLQALIYQGLGQVDWSLENYTDALENFETAVALDALPNPPHLAVMYQLAQLYFMQQRYDEALARLDSWLCMTGPEKVPSTAFVLQASIYMEQKDYPGALAAIEKAIAMDPDPRESWYQLELAAHYELEHYPQAADTLSAMISRWPDEKQYWVQLAQIEWRLKQETKALAVLALAQRRGLLDSQAEILFLVSLYGQANIPYKAAEVLEQGILSGLVASDRYHWTLTAESWYAAGELDKSLSAYEQAGRAASDGVTDLRRGFILVDREDWRAALEALDRALEKGGLDGRETGEAYLLRGMARYYLADYDRASADWGKAGQYEKTREAARQWENFLREKLRRQVS